MAMTDEQISEAVQRANAWLPAGAWEGNAISEESMALDVIDLADEIRAYRAALTPERVSALSWLHGYAETVLDGSDRLRAGTVPRQALDALDALIKLGGGE